MNNLILIHGYAGKDLSYWLQWLEKKQRDTFDVFFPSYEYSKTPVMQEWTNLFSKKLSNPNEEYNFVAHSLGSLVTMKLIEKSDIKVENAILVACPRNKIESHQQLLDKIDDESIKDTFTIFVEHEYNWDLINSKIKNLTFFFSDDDFAIPYQETISYYQDIFPEAVFKTFHNYGHFNRKNEVFELPEILDSL